MTEKQIKQKFKETYPDFMRGNEPLSPYFDIWEYGIEIATKELQEENKTFEGCLLAEQEHTLMLEKQIEKMKCCENCGWFYLQQHWRESKEIDESRMFHCGTCGNKKNWKLKEIKEND